MLNTVATSSVMHLFASFRPSERDVLVRLATDDREAFVAAMEQYLHGWAGGDWVEEYSIERIAKWIVRTCPIQVVDELKSHASEQLGVNSVDSGDLDITTTPYHKTYRAMLVGLGAVPEYA